MAFTAFDLFIIFYLWFLIYDLLHPIVGIFVDYYMEFFSTLKRGEADYNSLFGILGTSAMIGSFLFSLLFGFIFSLGLYTALLFLFSAFLSVYSIYFLSNVFDVDLSERVTP